MPGFFDTDTEGESMFRQIPQSLAGLPPEVARYIMTMPSFSENATIKPFPNATADMRQQEMNAGQRQGAPDYQSLVDALSAQHAARQQNMPMTEGRGGFGWTGMPALEQMMQQQYGPLWRLYQRQGMLQSLPGSLAPQGLQL